MACTAVLIPCHSGSAEALPEGVSADDVLHGPLLCTKLDSCRQMHWSAASFNSQVNEVATAAVGFMIHGDALITQSTGPRAATADLLSEVQASLNQLSGFNTRIGTEPRPTGRDAQQPASRMAVPSQKAPDIPLQAVNAPQSYVLSAPRYHRQTAPTTAELSSTDISSLPDNNSRLSQVTAAAPEAGLFQSPDLPGLQQPVAGAQQAGADAQYAALADVWGGMQSELLGNVLRQVRWTSREAIALSGVCRSWRSSVTADQQFLRSICVCINPKAPLRGSQLLCECCRGVSVIVQQTRHKDLPLPRVVHKAAHSGNISASVCVAQIMDGRGDTAAALKFWSKAAKLSHPEAQFRLGRACYEGVGVAADAQDALLWLARATKTLIAEDLGVESISNISTASLLVRRNQMHHDRQQGMLDNSKTSFRTEASMPEEQVLAKAALLLGFLHLDGEATKFDAAEALKWFKVALLNDCAEAEPSSAPCSTQASMDDSKLEDFLMPLNICLLLSGA